MNRQVRTRNILKLFFGIIIICIYMAVDAGMVHAQGNTIEVQLKTSSEGRYDDGGNYKRIDDNIKNITDASTVSLVTSNSDAVGIVYVVEDYSDSSSEINSKDMLTDNITFTAKQLKYIASQNSKDIEEGVVTDVYLYAKRAGTADITMTIDNSGVVTTKNYHVTVAASKPQFNKKLEKSFSDSGRVSDSGIFLNESIGLSVEATDFANISMSCNKEDGVKVCYDGEYKGKKWIEKKMSLGKTYQEIPNNEYYTFVAQKTGNLKITLKIEQDGKIYNKTYKLFVKKYNNPFKSFIIGGKNYKKYFDQKRYVTDAKPIWSREKSKKISVKDCKRTLGAKFNIKWKKGYKLKKITYVNAGEYAVMRHKLKRNATKLPKEFWELYITYTDDKGRTWTNVIHYSSFVISPY